MSDQAILVVLTIFFVIVIPDNWNIARWMREARGIYPWPLTLGVMAGFSVFLALLVTVIGILLFNALSVLFLNLRFIPAPIPTFVLLGVFIIIALANRALKWYVVHRIIRKPSALPPPSE